MPGTRRFRPKNPDHQNRHTHGLFKGLRDRTTPPAEIVRNALRVEGCAPEIDKDGDVVFKYKDFTMLVIFEDRDTEFLRMLHDYAQLKLLS